MARINFAPVSLNLTDPDGNATTFRNYAMGRHSVWIEVSLRGRELRRRLRESTGLDKRQRRRFLRRHGKALAA